MRCTGERDGNNIFTISGKTLAFQTRYSKIEYRTKKLSNPIKVADISIDTDKSFFKEHQSFEFDAIYEKGTYQVIYVFKAQVLAEDEIAFNYYQFIENWYPFNLRLLLGGGRAPCGSRYVNCIR